MAGIFRRRLFWQVYATLLASLVLVAMLGALLLHLAGARAMPPPSAPAMVASALLPSSDAPAAAVTQPLARLAKVFGEPVSIMDGRGRLIAQVAGTGRPRLAHGMTMRLADRRILRIGPDVADSTPHMLVMLLLVAAAVGVAAYPVISRLTDRLERLRHSLDAWGDGDLTSRADTVGADEIAAVAASFNAAADRVERLLAAHRELLAHASHELRSPLARLRMAVEIWAEAPDPALKPQILRDIAELSALVDEILLASRLDQAVGAPGDETVDCLELAAEEAARAGVEVRGSQGASFEVTGSARLVRRLIRNLIDNAVRHGRPPVTVTLDRTDTPEGGTIVIAVADAGPGITESERVRVFEPFYRPAGAAESDGSWGLGLSIVRRIAERHGGTVTCGSGPDGGARFTVVLPARGAAI